MKQLLYTVPMPFMVRRWFQKMEANGWQLTNLWMLNWQSMLDSIWITIPPNFRPCETPKKHFKRYLYRWYTHDHNAQHRYLPQDRWSIYQVCQGNRNLRRRRLDPMTVGDLHAKQSWLHRPGQHFIHKRTFHKRQDNATDNKSAAKPSLRVGRIHSQSNSAMRVQFIHP